MSCGTSWSSRERAARLANVSIGIKVLFHLSILEASQLDDGAIPSWVSMFVTIKLHCSLLVS